ncbi:MAG: hypothetical protein LBD31_10680 [Treponema sp.]|jgi:hypothetical protein|nr:hypothetical protein [Treponema sp.]
MAKTREKKAKQDQFIDPIIVFFVYIAAAFILICSFYFIFPAQKEPLACYTVPWRFVKGLTAFIKSFPALAFSALVIPFGLREHSAGGYAGSTYVGSQGFSLLFLKYITWPVITACTAVAVYGLLFFLVFPLASDFGAAMEDQGELYIQAQAKAKTSAAGRDWDEAARFISICERIWSGNGEIEKLKTSVTSALASRRQSEVEAKRKEIAPDEGAASIWPGIPGDPVNSADALRLAEEALNGERYYDAHWLATLAQRLAVPGNAETGSALALASRAWEKIAALAPGVQEQERYSLYRMKREGYEALTAGDWIGAFYVFQELSALTPADPDVDKYLTASRNGVANVAFFIDELDLAIGHILTGAVFSFPGNAEPELSQGDAPGGRIALRFASLASLPDFAYAWGPEAVAADGEGNFRYRVSADYAKLVPVTLKDNAGKNTERVVLLLRALDRNNREGCRDPVWVRGESGGVQDSATEPAQIMLNVSYADFLLLSKLKRGIDGLGLNELFAAEERFGGHGYISESFRAEILYRLADPLFFLPLTILALILGWRYRAQKKPRYVYVPMLGILPLIFYGILIFYRSVLNSLSIWLSLNFTFSTAMICFIAGTALCFITALILLASQHG